MAILLGVLATRNMNPVVTTVTGLQNQLIKISVMLKEVEPLLGDVHISVLTVIIP